MENLVGKATTVTRIYWRWRQVLPSATSSHNPRIDPILCGKQSLYPSRFDVTLNVMNEFRKTNQLHYRNRDWLTWRISCCQIVWVFTYVSFSYFLQDVVLTVSLLSLPQRFEQKIAIGILEYLLNEIYYILALQLFSFIILTICLIRIPSMIVDILYKEITLTKNASTTEVVELVDKWKGNWLVICDLLAYVNDFIGRPLFLYIIYGFFVFFSYTFFILFRILTDDGRSLSSSFIAIYFILKFLASFCLLAFEAEKIPSKVNYRMNFDTWSTKMNPVFNFQVSNISNRLRHVKVTVYAIQNQVSLL